MQHLLTAADSISGALLSAATAGDLDGVALFSELAVQSLGYQYAAAALRELPLLCEPDEVPTVLSSLHGRHWIDVARAVVLQACVQMAAAGVRPGTDISFASDENGGPILLMTAATHRGLQRVAPGSLHLITGFLQID